MVVHDAESVKDKETGVGSFHKEGQASNGAETNAAGNDASTGATHTEGNMPKGQQADVVSNVVSNDAGMGAVHTEGQQTDAVSSASSESFAGVEDLSMITDTGVQYAGAEDLGPAVKSAASDKGGATSGPSAQEVPKAASAVPGKEEEVGAIRAEKSSGSSAQTVNSDSAPPLSTTLQSPSTTSTTSAQIANKVAGADIVTTEAPVGAIKAEAPATEESSVGAVKSEAQAGTAPAAAVIAATTSTTTVAVPQTTNVP